MAGVTATVLFAAALALLVRRQSFSSPDAADAGPSPAYGSEPSGRDREMMVRELEHYACFVTDPDRLLSRCDLLRPALRGTPYERRLREIEEDAIRLKSAIERDRRLTTLLDDVRRTWESDPTFEKRVLVFTKLGAALEIAGDRREQVDQLRSMYEMALGEWRRLESIRAEQRSWDREDTAR